jgi:type IV secretory pathway TrbD component
MDFLKSIPAIGGLLKGKDGGATTSEFSALAGLYAAVITLHCEDWIKAVVLGAATVAYAWLRTHAKAVETVSEK